MARTSQVKEKICKCAQRLFNEKGYDQVSLREIAEAAGTTIGNLTYHFPQKENLIAMIQEDLHTGFADDLAIAEKGEDVLRNLFHSFREAQANEEANPFYYRNLWELCRDSAFIAKENEVFRARLFRYYQNCLIKLKGCGLVRPELSDKHCETLAYSIVVLSTVWIQNASPYYDKDLPKPQIEEALMDLIFPYLTEAGRHIHLEYWSQQ